jgi:hypothetical protein
MCVRVSFRQGSDPRINILALFEEGELLGAPLGLFPRHARDAIDRSCGRSFRTEIATKMVRLLSRRTSREESIVPRDTITLYDRSSESRYFRAIFALFSRGTSSNIRFRAQFYPL